MKKHHHSLVDVLAQSQLYLDYQKAFNDSTGLPLSLQPVDSWHLPLHGQKNESRFCAIMASQSHSCADCLQMRQKISERAIQEPCTMECCAGISESAVPVRMGDKRIGLLHTGQVFRSTPTAARFDQMAKMAGKRGLQVDVPGLRDAYFATRVVPPKQYAASVHLLSFFAEQLSLLANQMLVQERWAEPPVITRAKRFIAENYENDLSLGDVAKACHTSPFYFCKLFKRETGVNFTEYVCNVRTDKAKNLLLNRNLRVSEIGYEVGFQSLTHFNRVFKAMVGQSPTKYRHCLPNQAVSLKQGAPSLRRVEVGSV